MAEDIFKKKIAESISSALGKEISPLSLEIPPDKNMGDYAFPCFLFAKELGKSPVEIANELSGKILPGGYISSIKPLGPYVNFFVVKEVLAKYVLEKIFSEGKDYGKGNSRKAIMVEGWQPNTHKAFHIGHIRNAVLSESISRLLEFNGCKVIRASYMGDIGAHVAKWIWYFKRFYKGDIPEDNVSKWAGELYTEATKASEGNEEYENEIHEVHKRLEEGDKELTELWKKTRELCLNDFWKIFDELGCKIERPYFESEVEQPGIKKVKELAEKGFAKYSDGAIIMDLEEAKLGVFVLLKSNGASLYSTKDIALAYLKSEEYKFDLSLYIVASEQDHHFRQLFKTLEIIGYSGREKLVHVSYGLVKLQEGKMSSRLGNIILYEDFRDQLINKITKLMEERDIQGKEEISKEIAYGAMKFTMLNQDSQKEIIFNYDQALSFDGETGPYVQYTHARAGSILKKYGKNIDGNVDFSLLSADEEKAILRLLGWFPEACKKAAKDYAPAYITRYLLDLCQAFNEYYHKHKIIQEDKELEKARALLVFCTKSVISSALGLLSINAPESM